MAASVVAVGRASDLDSAIVVSSSDPQADRCDRCGGSTKQHHMYDNDRGLICLACAAAAPLAYWRKDDVNPARSPDQIRLLVLLDLNGVLVHRLRDGKSFGTDNELELPAGDHGFPAYMVIRPGSKELLEKLVDLENASLCTWGFCTTMKFSNAWQVARKMLSHLGFEFEEPVNSVLSYEFGEWTGKAWFFTMENLQVDADVASFTYRNTGHRQVMPSTDLLLYTVTAAAPDIATHDRMIMVLGNAKKAKLCHKQALLIRDFDSRAAEDVARTGQEQPVNGLERALNMVDQTWKGGSIEKVLWDANRRFVLHKILEACAEKTDTLHQAFGKKPILQLVVEFVLGADVV